MLKQETQKIVEEVSRQDWFHAIDTNVDDSLTESCLDFLTSKLKEISEKTVEAVKGEERDAIPAMGDLIALQSIFGFNSAVHEQEQKIKEWMQ